MCYLIVCLGSGVWWMSCVFIWWGEDMRWCSLCWDCLFWMPPRKNAHMKYERLHWWTTNVQNGAMQYFFGHILMNSLIKLHRSWKPKLIANISKIPLYYNIFRVLVCLGEVNRGERYGGYKSLIVIYTNACVDLQQNWCNVMSHTNAVK